MIYSNRTYELDSAGNRFWRSKDVVHLRLDAEGLDKRVRAVQAANDKQVTFEEGQEPVEEVAQQGRGRGRRESVRVEGRAQPTCRVNTAWRLSNRD